MILILTFTELPGSRAIPTRLFRSSQLSKLMATVIRSLPERPRVVASQELEVRTTILIKSVSSIAKDLNSTTLCEDFQTAQVSASPLICYKSKHMEMT